MPLTSFIDLKDNSEITFDSAVTGKSTLGFSRDILFQIVKQNTKSNYGASSISVTALLSCIRKTYLEKTLKYSATPEKCWYSLRGTLFHELLDPGQEMDGWLSERRFYRMLSSSDRGCRFCEGDGWSYNKGLKMEEPCSCCSVGGQIDGYDCYTNELLDKKSIGDFGLLYLKDGAKEPHRLQVNIYRWLMEEGITYKLKSYEKRVIKRAGGSFVKFPGRKGWYAVKLPVSRMRIQYFSMMDVVITGGLMTIKTQPASTDPQGHPNEVKREVISSFLKDMAKGPTEVKRWALTYKVPDVEIMPDDMIRSFIEAKKHDLIVAYQSGVIPPMCDEDTRGWLCGFCGCKDVCAQINTEGFTVLNEKGEWM